MHIQHTLHQIFSVLPISIILYTNTVLGQDCGSQGDCPTVTLPWGTWQANSYTETGDFFTFQNIRFGKEPIGDLRFAKSVRPDNITDSNTQQANTYGPSCIGVNPKAIKAAIGGKPLGLGQGTPYYDPIPNQNEDCLFLDVYVPRNAFTSQQSNVPVVVWFYGGAFVFGSKEVNGTQGLFYGGTSFLQMAQEFKQEMIFVVGNYRLGAFGWLAGSYMEANGTPNAGLTDQRLLLQWVHDFIHLFGGDNTQVSAWGESAGAGSIIHHLVANGGTTDPLFQKVIVQSPAYFWAWDRSTTGSMNTIYRHFARIAGCPSGNIACLRAANVTKLEGANFNITVDHAARGLMAFGPAVDGTLIQHLPAVEFQNKHFWPNISSLILSHVAREADIFIPKKIKGRKAFNTFIQSVFPGQPAIAEQIVTSTLYRGLFRYRERLIEIARDAFFTGNVLQLYNAYQSTAQVYVTEYSWPAAEFAIHGLDLFPIFYHKDAHLKEIIENGKILPNWTAEWVVEKMKYFSPRYKQYFVSHAITGDPNQFWYNATHYNWTTATYNDENVLQSVAKSSLLNCMPYSTCFRSIEDDALSQDRWEFWTEIASTLTPPSSSSSGQSESQQQPLGFSDELK